MFLNEVYETVYSMNVEPGLLNKKVDEAMYKWLLASQVSLLKSKTLVLLLLTLQHDPDFQRPPDTLTEERSCINILHSRDPASVKDLPQLNSKVDADFCA
jgi:hypothetical protein